MPLKDYNRIQQVGQGGFGDAYLVEMKSDRKKKVTETYPGFRCINKLICINCNIQIILIVDFFKFESLTYLGGGGQRFGTVCNRGGVIICYKQYDILCGQPFM